MDIQIMYSGFLKAKDSCKEGSLKEVIEYNFLTLNYLFKEKNHDLLSEYVKFFLSDEWSYIVLKSVFIDFSKYAHYTKDENLLYLSGELEKYYMIRKKYACW